MPQFCLNHEYVMVSSNFIEEYMPKANATFVKVYLYALNLAANGEKVEYSAVARVLNLLESDVMQAFAYWKEEGVLNIENDTIFFGNAEKISVQKKEIQEKVEKKPVENVTDVATRHKYAPGQAATAISDNSTLSEMTMLAQEILGKTLNTTDTETLFWFYDGLKFAPEVILMLLEYCVSKEKRRMNYIEKVAVSWHERGITSMEAVNEYLEKESERSGYVYSIRKLFGIIDRSLSQSEEQFINRWHEMYKMEEDMVSLAYEQCIIQTSKLSFPYMEKILERWHKQGIHTVELAEKDSREFKNSAQNSNNQSNSEFGIFNDNYDHESLEELTRKKYNRS